MVLQVLTLGVLLVPVFSYHSWWLVLLFSTSMLLVSAVEVASRPAFSYDAMLQHSAVALGAAVGAALLYCYLLVLPAWPVWQVREI
jgi:ABC-type iron transport system FetAB permease component